MRTHPAIPATPRVIVLTRSGCHLCVDVLAVVRAVCADLAVAMAEIDVDTVPSLKAEYTDHVPVTFLDGVRFDFWRIDESRLRAALR